MLIRHCGFDGWQNAGAPRVRCVQGLASHDRALARSQARVALRSCLAAELGYGQSELEISNLRAQAPRVLRQGRPVAELHCSISHAAGLALLAWHWGGPIGVDIQAVDVAMPRRELQDVAELYLEQKTAQSLAGKALDALFYEAFTQAWTSQEARLKCAGLGLTEWTQALELQLAGMLCAPLSGMGAHAAAVAWKAA